MTAQPTFSPTPQTPASPPAPQRRTGRVVGIAIAVLAAMAGAAIVFLTLAAGAVRDEVVLRQRGQVAPATVLEINRSERRKNLPARVVLGWSRRCSTVWCSGSRTDSLPGRSER